MGSRDGRTQHRKWSDPNANSRKGRVGKGMGAARRESDERTAAHTVSVGGMGPAHSFSLFFFFICFLLFPLSFHAPNYSLLLHNKYVPLKIRVKP
jgi:hypothetical protein